MPDFRIPKPPRSSYKTIPIPNDMIKNIETEIRQTDCSFSDFVVEAVRAALADTEKSKRRDDAMIDENDWRLVDQTRYLMHVPLKKAVYHRPGPTWDHDHCNFCWDTFSEYDGDLHEGYCTPDETYWICPECFADFKEMFHWTLAEMNQ